MIDFSDLNAAAINAFGESVLFTLQGGAVFLPVIFDVNQDRTQVADLPINSSEKTLSMLQSDVNAHGIEIRGKVQVRNVDYQILDIEHDAGGMSLLQIRRYA
jgi:hypothetical protein